jgi:hypothetical protein
MTILQTTTSSERVAWKAAVGAGLIAGAVFLMMEMILLAVVGESPWGPPRMMAAIVMGEAVLPPPATFDLTVVMVAMIVHFMLSIALAVAFAWGLSLWYLSFGAALALGGAFGLLVYLVNFYPVPAILFPWFAMARNWITISSHVVFGAVLAWAYLALTRGARGAAERGRLR